MTHTLTLELGDADDLAWAQRTVTFSHYLHAPVDPRARPMCYVIRDTQPPLPQASAPKGVRIGLVMLGIPHATRCRGWWGYDNLPTQWQVVDICRVWISAYSQRGELGVYAQPDIVPGFFDRLGVFRPTVATWAIAEVLQRVQADRVRLWPPVLLSDPYHIRLAISYHDPRYHRGTIYRESGAMPMYIDCNGQPKPGPAGKFGWAWKLPEPSWQWEDLTAIQPRTIRMF